MTARKLLKVVAAVALVLPLWGQPDEPDRGVARISLLNGDVSVRRGDSGDFVAAALNAPLVLQDRVLTGIGSRAELQFDWANFLRLSHNAEVRLAELEYRRYMVQLARGTVTWRVLRDQDAYVEISTPSVSVRPTRRGIYRLTVLDDGSSEITVRNGEAEIFTPRGSERLRSGRTMLARGSAGDPEFRVGDDIPEDEWDRWNVARDRDLERSRSYQYLSRDIYGAEDLDSHGRWVHAPSYGWVWSPRVAVGWAPYRQGRWVWMDWYGWTWVSHDPWGWAPYHYGRWFWHSPVGWCWWPGSIGVRHRWSPGIVAFVGFGGGGVGVGWGRVGWVPLGPHEPFHRWWGSRWYGGYRSRGYIDNSVTVVNNVNVTNIYRNSRIDNAITVVDQDGFRRGRFNDRVRVTTDEIRTASVARGPLPLTPERESLRLADREASVRGIERSGSERFFSRSRPAEVDRVPFEDQRRGVEQIARRNFGEAPGSRSVVEAGRPADAARPAVDASRASEQRGWRRIDQSPQVSGSERAIDRGNASGERGVERSNVDRGSGTDWRRFGSPRTAEGTGAPRDVPGTARGFGEPVSPRGADAAERGVSADGWRRFGSGRVTEGSAVPRGESVNRSESLTRGESVAPRGVDNSGRGDSTDWRRFDGGRGTESGPSGVRSDRGIDNSRREAQPSAPTIDRSGGNRSFESPRMERRDWSGSRGGDRGESIRISPPIIRERGSDAAPRGGGRSFEGPRSAPSGGDAGGMRGGGGGGRSAPSGDSGGGRSSGGGGSRGGSRGR